MKQIAIILLLLSVVLSAVSCGRAVTRDSQENAETPATAINYDESGKNDETRAESDDASETKSAAEEEDRAEDRVYFDISESSEIYYLTSSADRSYGERGSEYTNENKILGAVIFDSVPSRLLFSLYQTKMEKRADTEHENYYGWFDCCLYPLNDECMNGGAVSFVTQDEIYSLDGAEIFTGTTADGSGYCFYKTAGEGGVAARYYGFISLGNEHMAAVMLSDDGKNADEWNSGFKPMLDSARVYTAGESGELVYEYYIKYYDGDAVSDKYKVRYTFPDTWDTSYIVGDDLPRKLDGRYSTKRFEIIGLLSAAEKDESDLEYPGYATEYDSVNLGETGHGYEYEIRTEKAMSEGEKLSAAWHHIWIRVPETKDDIYLRFVTYGDDEEGYYEKYCLPVLDSIEIDKLS